MKVKTLSLIILGIFLFSPFTNASLFSSKDITFSTSQKDYYFKTGENAIIPLNIENSYGKQIDGLLTYNYSQQINQGGMQMSSSNSQSTLLSIKNKESTLGLNFGTSNSPSTLDISLRFSYTEKESRVVNLDRIKIHFVSDENQKQNQQDKQSSSSEKQSQSNQNQQNTQSQIQKQIDEIMGRNQQQNKQTTQQKMQNNQLGQDSSALKKQMQRQAEEQEQMKKEFQDNLGKNSEFQKQHQSLLNQGYNISSGNLNPTSNNSGSFDLQYKKQNGETAELKGNMQNNEMKNIQSLTQEDKNKMMQELQKNKDFQELNKKVQKQGFKQQETQFNLGENKTNINIDYKNPQNQTQIISADVINGTIQNVQIQNPEEEDYSKNYFWVWFFIILIILLTIGYYFYKKYYKKKQGKIKEETITIKKKPFDYLGEAKKLLNKAKKLFEESRHKDAYEKAGQSLRLYLSYKHNLKKETTNDEIIHFLKKLEINTNKIKECFGLCSLVEFAKYKANKKDFDKITEFIQKIFNKAK